MSSTSHFAFSHTNRSVALPTPPYSALRSCDVEITEDRGPSTPPLSSSPYSSLASALASLSYIPPLRAVGAKPSELMRVRVASPAVTANTYVGPSAVGRSGFLASVNLWRPVQLASAPAPTLPPPSSPASDKAPKPVTISELEHSS
jgi:hypothetical protein